MAAILVSKGESPEQILDRPQPDPLQVRGATRADPLQELQGRREEGDCQPLARHLLNDDGLAFLTNFDFPDAGR
jgi:hypothetical protein